MYFNKGEDLGEEECKLGYKEDEGDENDSKYYEGNEKERHEFSERKFATYPIPPLDISPLIWDTPPNPMEIGSDSEFKGKEGKVIAGMAYDYLIDQVIGDDLLHSKLARKLGTDLESSK